MMSKIYTAVPILVCGYQAPSILCPSSNCLQADTDTDLRIQGHPATMECNHYQLPASNM